MHERDVGDIADRVRAGAARRLAQSQRSSATFFLLLLFVAALLALAVLASAYAFPRAITSTTLLLGHLTSHQMAEAWSEAPTALLWLVGATVVLLFWTVVARVMVEALTAADRHAPLTRSVDRASASNPVERALVEMVEKWSRQLSIPTPRIGIADDPEINACATGLTLGDALIVVNDSTLKASSLEDLEAVICHELGHVANRDFRFMTLFQVLHQSSLWALSRPLYLLPWLSLTVARIFASATQRSDSISAAIAARLALVSRKLFNVERSAVEVVGFPFELLLYASKRSGEFRADAIAGTLLGKQRAVAGLRRVERLTSTSRVEDLQFGEPGL